MMRLAINETLLPEAEDETRRFEAARAAGFDGVELIVYDDLPARMPALMSAMQATGMAVASVLFESGSSVLSASLIERETGLTRLRETLTCAADLGAAGVVIAPGVGEARLPDLSPLRDDRGLAHDLMVAHVRTLEDFAGAFNTRLLVAPSDPYFLEIEDAVGVVEARNNPHVRLAFAPHPFSQALTPSDVLLRQVLAWVGYVRLDPQSGTANSKDGTALAALAAALKAGGFDGWTAVDDSASVFPYTERSLNAIAQTVRSAGFDG